MEKRTLLALVTCLVLGVAGYAAMRAPQKGERTGPPPRPFPAIKAADVTGLEIVDLKGEKTTIARKDGAWRVTAPGDWPADAQAVKAITDAIEKVHFGDIATENAGKHDELGVSDKAAVHLKIITAAQSPELLLGKPMAGFTMLRVAGKNEVWQATGLTAFPANKGPKDWRDHKVLSLNAADVDRLAVEVPGGDKIVLERAKPAGEPAKPGDPAKPAAAWKVLESSGAAPKPASVFDAAQPQTTLQALAALRASDFADGKSAKDAGLEPPALLITATAAGKEQVLEIGGKQGDEVYVRPRGGAIYLVKKYSIERAAARPVDYRDKTLSATKVEDLTHVRVAQGKDVTELEKKDGKWALAGGAPLDAKKAAALAGGLTALYGTSVVTDKAAKTGLDKPRAIITVGLKDGAKTTIKVGAAAEGGDYYASREGDKDVFVAKKFAIDRLLKKPADLAPAPAKK